MDQAEYQAELQALRNTTGVLNSVKAWMDGSAARQQVAVDKAVALGASPEMVQGFRDEIALQTTKADEVAAAIVANPDPQQPQSRR